MHFLQKVPPCRPLVANAYETCRLSSILDPKIAKSAFLGEKVEISQKNEKSSFFAKKSQKHSAAHFLVKSALFMIFMTYGPAGRPGGRPAGQPASQPALYDISLIYH